MRPEALHHDACGAGFLADRQGRARADLLPLALTALVRMQHRGGVGGDGETGDGAGVLTQVPWRVLLPELARAGHAGLRAAGFGVGLVFLPVGSDAERAASELVALGLARHGLSLVGWRDTPTRDGVLGSFAAQTRPRIRHLLVARPELSDAEFEQRLFAARREIEGLAAARGLSELYVASLSHQTLVYKALLRASELEHFYEDLRHPEFRTAFAVFHNRFSTNTHPSWEMTQPFRMLAHNGEINTIDGNRAWMRARAASAAALGIPGFGCAPLLAAGTSDSASLDEALRLLVAAGRSTLEAVSMLMPPAWENDPERGAAAREFYDDAARRVEAWDGPALAVFADGRVVGAALDRNGLRPARYSITDDGLVLLASEAGVLDVPDERILYRGRLGPGGLLAVDLLAGRLVDRDQFERGLPAPKGAPRPRPTPSEPPPADAAPAGAAVLGALGFTREELQLVLGPMYRQGVEPVGSMGDDTPLAVLSQRPRLLFSYFKQRFAQVTNPPIDPMRERVVMSLRTSLGARGSLFGPSALPTQIDIESPLLSRGTLRALRSGMPGLRARTLELLFDAAGGAAALGAALERLLRDAEQAVAEGAAILILSDRGIDASRAAMPALLAVAAVHHHLIRRGLRLQASLVADAGEARDDHQVACLIGFGADAVHPWAALAAIAAAAPRVGVDPAQAEERYLGTLEKGLLKILSKMGIATARSYHGAQLFEAVGLEPELLERHFTGVAGGVGGALLSDLAADVLARHARAFGEARDLEEGGEFRYRKGAEAHAFEPRVVKALHAALRGGTRLDYRRYAELVESRPPIALRDLLRLRAGAAIPLEEVEPAEALFPRFATSAMSLGALSPEAHRMLAVAMNRLGGRSNSGEGGEPAEHFWRSLPGGLSASHHTKQVASARFGVTTEYLVAARELQIKMAQGSKPGEGGQLPGAKVAAHIARVRHSPIGVTLISPPPHHDIYSIEDLAQLIHDLKRVNADAAVSVKLVSGAGVGTIAAGVVKAGADAIVLGGHDGGTGASPLGSIKNAGTPWEIGLLDVQATLREQGLRASVRLLVEGGFKTGRDVVLAAALGADEFGFGTAALVAAGCVMARQCHLDTCPAGIATQREELRRRVTIVPDQVIRFFGEVAEEVREALAALGCRSLKELIGRSGILEQRPFPAAGRAARVSLAGLLHDSDALSPRSHLGGRRAAPPGSGIDEAVLQRLRFEGGHVVPLETSLPISNADRSVGARIAGELVRRRHGHPLPPDTLRLHFRGAAGQSFGAFAIAGMRLVLEGEANDGVAKGLSGGEVVLRPSRPRAAGGALVVAGNAVLYGATSGRLFVAGRVGERFGVRNSGALAVVEGTGDHACEYMTAGAVVILGETGRNLGAGMSGGVAYAYDAEETLAARVNQEMVRLEPHAPFDEQPWLYEALERHLAATGSLLAASLLRRWQHTLACFRRIVPRAGAEARLPRWAAHSEALPPLIARAVRG
jgi:glutamate synthase domain-containing protein 2/glutamate synthase domain-containing protein 1/glutamate synthase domain-containing protein 3